MRILVSCFDGYKWPNSPWRWWMMSETHTLTVGCGSGSDEWAAGSAQSLAINVQLSSVRGSDCADMSGWEGWLHSD
jgi:hypothetical protein